MIRRSGHFLLLTLALAGCRAGSETGDSTLVPARVATPKPTAAAPSPPAADLASSATATPPTRLLTPVPAPRSTRRGATEAPRSGDASRGVARGPYLAPRVRIPSDVMAGGQVVPAGTYEVRLEPGPGGPSVALVRDGETVGRELAVRPVRQPTRSGRGSWVWVDHRQEPMVRVFTQAGRDLYFAVFPEVAKR